MGWVFITPVDDGSLDRVFCCEAAEGSHGQLRCLHQLPKPVLDQLIDTDNPDTCNLCIKTTASVEATGLIHLTVGNNLHLSEIYQVAQAGLLDKLPISAFPLRKKQRSRFVSANLFPTQNMTLHRLRAVSVGSAGNIQAASSFVEAHTTTRIIICPKASFDFMLALGLPSEVCP